MKYALCLLLVFASVVRAQGLDESIDAALDARTAPAQRIKALERVAKAQGGLDKLAEKGLDPALDPEVIHAVVDTLLQAPDYKAYVEPICRLLLVDRQKEKVRQRIQVLGENPERGRALLDECGRLAREAEDPNDRKAALLALFEIPQRRALEIIVEAGRADDTLRPLARDHVALYLGVRTLDEAAAFLQEHARDSFWDFVRRKLRRDQEQRLEREEYERALLASAPLDRVLATLKRQGAAAATRTVASARLKDLVAKNDLKDPVAVAGQVFEIFLTERDRGAGGDGTTLENLLVTLRQLTKDKAPLWQAVDRAKVLDAIEPLAMWPGPEKERQQVGSAAVRFLGAIEDEGRVLKRFAEDFPNTDVRKDAVQYLAQLVRSYEHQRAYVGIVLAGLLKRGEKDAAVRTQILATLATNDVPTNADALDVIRSYFTSDVQPPLSDAEFKDCITILSQAGTEDATAVLLKAAAEYPRPEVRRLAIEEGLLPRARREKDPARQKAILDQVQALILSADQPEPVRRAAIEALGRKGTRLAHATLNEIQRAEGLPEELAAAVVDAKIALATRLATPGEGGALDRDDLMTAATILEEEWRQDPTRMEKLADAIVHNADAQKLPVGSARFLRARLYRLAHAEPDGNVLLGLYEEAAARARDDVVPVDLLRSLLTEYRDLLVAGDDPSPDRLQKAIGIYRQLAQMALDDKDKVRAADLFLKAADCAVRTKDAAQAEALLNSAQATGGLGGDLTPEEKRLRGEVDRLRKAPGAPGTG